MESDKIGTESKHRVGSDQVKILFFNKVIFEGTEEECELFRKDLIKMLFKLDDELRDTYPMKKTDTYQMYYEALKTLNPFIYETLSYLQRNR